MASSESAHRCEWDEDKREWSRLDAQDKRVGACTSFRESGGGRGASPCTELFPAAEMDTDIFVPDMASTSQHLAIKSVLVHDVSEGRVHIANFEGARLVPGQRSKVSVVP